MERATDIELLQAWALRQDRDAMGELIRREIDFVYATAVRHVRDVHLAEDVTQAVFILLMQKAHRIKNGGALTRWLFTTTRFAAANALKLKRRRENHERRAAAMFPETAFESNAVDEETHRIIDDAIARLPRLDRACVVMTYLQEKSNQQAAVELGLSEGAVRMRVSRAMLKMKAFLESRGIVAGAAALAGGTIQQPKASAQLLDSTIRLAATTHASASAPATALVKAISKAVFMNQLKVAVAILVGLLLAGLAGGQALRRETVAQVPPNSPASQPTTAEAMVIDDKPTLTLADLLAGARARREAIRDLSVMSEWHYVKIAPDSNAVTNERDHLVIKGERIYLDKSYTMNTSAGQRTARRLLAYDGTQSAIYAPFTPLPGRGRLLPAPLMMMKGLNSELNLDTVFFMELNLLLRPDAPTKSASLESILAAPQTKVRDRLEAIDGHPCYVIDEPRERQIVYIDASRGFVPLRWEIFDRKGKLEIYAWTDHVIEVEKGIWLATHGRRHVAAMSSLLKPGTVDSETELEIAVDGWDTDHPALAVNSGVKDSFFDLPNRMPKGTQVVDDGPDGRGKPRGAPKDTDPENPILPPFPDSP